MLPRCATTTVASNTNAVTTTHRAQCSRDRLDSSVQHHATTMKKKKRKKEKKKKTRVRNTAAQ